MKIKPLLQLLKMTGKLTLYGFVIQALFFSILSADNLGAQDIQSIKEVYLDVNFRNASILDVFKKIEQETGYSFAYEKNEIDKNVKITKSYQRHRQTVSDILLHVSQVAGLHFKQINNNIIVNAIGDRNRPADLEIEVIIQTRNITGTVVAEENGEGLPGVNVVEKGTTNGTVTNVEGQYNLTVGEGATLVFSSVGYTTEEILVGNRSEINLEMYPDIQQLQELVVVGYGTQKKEDVTGSIVSADLDAMDKQPNVSIMEGLQGTVPGLNIGQVSEAGENPNISIRGQTSLSGEQNPLIVVDGVIFRGQLIDINPSDIESVDVLRDASATAIYGSQAANGVLMITTKSGSDASGEPIIRYSGQYSFQQPHRELRAETDPDAFMLKIEHSDIFQSRTEASGYLERNPDWAETTNFKTSHEIRQFNAGRSFDWYDHVTTDNPYTTRHNLSIANSTENNSYFASMGYTKQDGHLADEYYQRINGRINLTSSVTNWFDIDFQSFLTVSEYGPQSYSLNDRYIEPFATPYDEDGVIVQRPYGNPVNPIIEAQAEMEDKRLNLNGNLTGTIYLPLEGLNYKIRFGNNYETGQENYFGSHGFNFQGSGYKRNDAEYTWSLDNILSYNKIFNEIHEVGVTLLYGVESREYSFTRAEGSNFTKDVLGFNRLQAAAADQQRVTTGGWKESSLYSMGRISYKLLDRYLINATIRRDGFSGFSEANKFGNFPSLALGWIISEESFMANRPGWLNWLKLRASYGATGNRTIGRYQTLAEVSGDFGYVTADGSSLFTQWISALESPDLRWEKTTGINVGIDFRTLEGRLTGSIDYYNNNTTDLLYNVDIPGISRFEIFPDNLGKIHNQGLEVLLSSVNVESGDFRWSTDLSFSRNRNEIVTLLGFDVDGDGREDDLISEGLFIGQSTGVIFDYQIDGIWQLGEDIPDGYEVGAYRVLDINADGSINGDDRTILGNSRPAYRFGINNKLNYKNWSLNFFINSIQGGNDRYLGRDDLYDLNILNNETHFNITFPEDIDYWTPENPDARYQRPGIKGSGGIAGRRFASRSFVRLRDVSLSYNLGEDILKFVQNVRVTLSGRNLLTITDWNGWDPETGQGMRLDGRPVMESYSLGLDVTF